MQKCAEPVGAMLFYIDARGKREVPDVPHEQLAAYVTRVRAEKGLSLNDVRRRGDIPTSTIHKIERPRQSSLPKYDTLVRLARGLGVPLSDLLQIVGYQDQTVESASSQNHGNHGRAMVLRVVAGNENAENHGAEPNIGESSAAARGIPEPGGQLTYVGDVVAVPILGAAACGEPLAAIMDQATEHLYLPPAFTRGADAAIRVRGDSMSGAGIVDGDFVLVKVADGVKPVSGKPVVVRTPDGYACKFYQEDELGVYLEEHIAGQQLRRVKYDQAELVGIVVGQFRGWA